MATTRASSSALATAAAEKGYAATTIADIVRHARVSKRTFYEHFADKEACLLAGYQHISDLLMEVLRNTEEDGAPVEGVTITATKDGQEYTATMDSDGKFSIEIPGEGGQVTVELDESTLPDGAELREGSSASRTLVMTPNQTLPLSFPIGADTRDVASKWDRVPQLVWNGLLFGVIYQRSGNLWIPAVLHGLWPPNMM